MSTITKVLALATATGAALAVPQMAYAGTTTGSAGATTVTISIPDRTAFDGPSCLLVPLTATFTGAGSADLDAYIEGSSNTVGAYVYTYSPGAVQDTIQVCPNIDGAGRYTLTGVLESGSVQTNLPPTTFTVARADTSITKVKARQKGSTVTISGKALAPSSRGRIGVSTEITIKGMLPRQLGGTGKWVTLGTTYTDQFGAFSYSGSTDQRLKGATIRVIASEAAWASSAQAETQIR